MKEAVPTPYYAKGDTDRIADFAKSAAPEFKAFLAFDRAIQQTDGAIPEKYRELIAVAVAHVTRCAYCIEAHVARSKQVGATKEELAEAIMVAAALSAGAAVAHGGMAMKFYDAAG